MRKLSLITLKYAWTKYNSSTFVVKRAIQSLVIHRDCIKMGCRLG